MLVFNPTAPSRNAPARTMHTLRALSGAVIGFIDNSKPNFSQLADDIAERLLEDHGVASTIKHSKRGPSIPAADAVITEFAQRCDLVITGSGD